MNLMHFRPPKNAHLAKRLGFCGRLYVLELVITANSLPTCCYNRLETRLERISALMLLLLLEITKRAIGSIGYTLHLHLHLFVREKT